MPKSSRSPFVSVILPIRNEAEHIKRSLGSVLAQKYPSGRLEIIVVDGMSEDGTKEIVRQFTSSQRRFSTLIIDNPKLIPPASLNLGFRQARGEIIIRIDGHCEITPDYVRNCVAHLQKDYAEAVGGAIETIGDTYTAQAIAITMSTFFGVGNSSFRITMGKQFFTDSVPFPAYRRETLERLGEYDEEMKCNEDDELNYRLIKHGGRILLAADIKSRYYSRGSLYLLWQQYFRYGLWKVRVLQKHPRQMRIRQFVPLVIVLALFGSLFVVLFPVSRPLASIFPLFYFGVNLIASSWTASKRGWQFLPILPLIFAILHLGYGLGFVIGLFKFWNRWGDKQGKAPVVSNQNA